jgi:short-subunit dehydrogenase
VLALTEALSEELKGSGVTVTALCPGITDTDMASDIQAGSSTKLPKQLVSDPADVAAEGVKALMAGQVVAVPGLPNQITAAWAQVTPRWLTRYVTGFAARRIDWLKGS